MVVDAGWMHADRGCEGVYAGTGYAVGGGRRAPRADGRTIDGRAVGIIALLGVLSRGFLSADGLAVRFVRAVGCPAGMWQRGRGENVHHCDAFACNLSRMIANASGVLRLVVLLSSAAAGAEASSPVIALGLSKDVYPFVSKMVALQPLECRLLIGQEPHADSDAGF